MLPRATTCDSAVVDREGHPAASKNAAAMITSADRIAVDPAAFDVDAARLEGLVADASPEALLEAVKLCHGDLLDGLNLQAEPFEEWLTAQRSRFRELAVQAHRLLLEHQISCDSHEAAVLTALRFLALDPTDEDAHRKLMRLYLAQGRKDAALRQFQICAETLQRELGLAPDAETRALHRSIAQARSDLASQSRPRGPCQWLAGGDVGRVRAPGHRRAAIREHERLIRSKSILPTG